MFYMQPAFAISHADDLKRVQAYLNEITTLEANFRQDSSGAPAFGKLYIAKPYKIKWDYLLPKQFLILSSKHQFIYYNPKVQEVTYIPSSKVPGFFLAEQNIEFGKNIEVLHVERDEKELSVLLQDKTLRKAELAVALVFKRQPFQLQAVKLEDRLQQTEIIITLSDLKLNDPIPGEAFFFKDPNFFKSK